MLVLELNHRIGEIPPAIPRMVRLVKPIEPVFIARRQRIPDFNLVCCITIRRAIKPFARDVVELEALTIDRGEVDGDCIEVAFGKIVGDIADVMGT